MLDAERLESRLVKGNRSIEILDGYEDVVEHELLFLFMDCKMREQRLTLTAERTRPASAASRSEDPFKPIVSRC